MTMYSKLLLTFIASIWFLSSNEEPQKAKGSDDQAIRSVVQLYQEAYNQQDAKKLAAQWATDASYINPVTGDSAEGREAIEKLFKNKFADGKKRRLEITIKSIEFPTADEAIENGVMKVTIDDQPAQQVAYQTEYVKENGKWMVKAMGEIELEETPSHYEQLKDLNWMVGKWEDSDENVDILFETQWDKYKNFITQNFTMQIYGNDSIEGKQIIGWDEAKEVIRSWVFDSDGGFGEGVWEKVDKSWHATMKYTLSDGSMASSTNIYTPVDDHSYTYASVEREVDGEILPDMDPVTVEKSE